MKDLQSIEAQLILAAFTSDKDLDQIKSLDTTDLEKFLATESFDRIAAEMQSMNGMLPPEVPDTFSQWQAKLSEFKLDETSSTVIFSIGNWKDMCSSIYKDGQVAFQANVLAMNRRELLPCLQRNLETQRAEAEKLREQNYKMEEDKFLSETKKKLSKSTGMQTQLHIESCAESKYLWIGPLRSICMVISCEEQENPSIQWRISELAPTKKDLDDLNLHSMHHITPSCSDTYDLVCCEPRKEDHIKVALLKS